MRRFPLTRALCTLLAYAAGLGGAAVAGATPAVVPGWPVKVAAGSVHPWGDRGATVIAETISGVEDPFTGIFAFDRRGRAQWRHLGGCALGLDCALSGQRPTRLPDGSYGPIAAAGSLVNIDAAGQVLRPACGGAQLPDGTCVAFPERSYVGATITATRGGVQVWQHIEPDLVHAPSDDEPGQVLLDGRGMVYVTLRDERPAVPQRLVAIDAATGAVRWRHTGGGGRVALTDGVLVETADAFTALRSDGSTLWTRATATLGFVPDAFALDLARGNIYVEQSGTPGIIAALIAGSGVERWRTSGHGSPSFLPEAALLSVGPSGTVYVSGLLGGRNGLRAFAPDGRRLWKFETASRVVGAGELSDGTVAISTEGVTLGSIQGLLTRISPHRSAGRVRTTRVSLSPTTVTMNCADLVRCIDQSADGAVLRMDFPRAMRVRLRVLTAAGGPVDRRLPQGFRDTTRFVAPKGTSFLRVLDFGNSGGDTIDPLGTGAGIVRPGRYQLEVTWNDRGRVATRRIAVSVTVARQTSGT